VYSNGLPVCRYAGGLFWGEGQAVNVIYLDTETHLFRPGLMAPPVVCLTWKRPGVEAKIAHVGNAITYLRDWFKGSENLFVGHYIAYDMIALGAQFPELVPDIFRAYDENRVTCTKIRQQLLDIAAGEYRGKQTESGYWIQHNYGLDDLARRFFGRVLDKGDDGWRKRYAELQPLPIEQWPERAVTYALEDVVTGLEVYELQEQHAKFIPDQFTQTYNSFARGLMSAWGLRTKAEMVRKLELETLADLQEITASLQAAGLVRADGSRDTKKAKELMLEACAKEKKPVRKTKTGGVCLDSDACNASEDPDLENYAEYSTLKSVLTKDVKALADGAIFPVHSRFDIVETGRTSSSKPNVQNWRRKAGIRECFVPRPGKVYYQADYPGLELHTLAQCCIWFLGHSELATALNADKDPHLMVASNILGKSYEWCQANISVPEVDNARQTGKVANFGFPGGLGAEKLTLFARKTYNVALTIPQAQDLKRIWFATWSEMREYLNYVASQVDPDTETAETQGYIPWVVHPISNRIRGKVTYCAGCNGYFQGLGADASQAALRRVIRACYVQQPEGTVDRCLFGSRVVNYVHDEIIGECDDNPEAHDKAWALARIMNEEANRFVPDCPLDTKPLLMRFWSKKAKAVTDAAGRLIPWDGSAKAA